MWFNKISAHKHDTKLHGKSPTNLIAQTAKKILCSCLRKLDSCFFLSVASEVIVRKNSKQTLPQVEKVTVRKLTTGF